MIYLDNAAHVPPSQELLDAIADDKNYFYNPSSSHKSSVMAQKMIEETKREILKIFNADPRNYRVIFTSSGCESNSLALSGMIEENDIREIITTPIEHASIMELVKHYERSNILTSYLNLDENGHVTEDTLSGDLQDAVHFLVSVQHVNNEVGVVQDIRMLSKIVHENQGYFHTDAVQSFLHVPIDLSCPENECPDLISISGHKIGAFSGIGALIVKRHIDISPIIFGHQEYSLRGGTENVVGIYSLLLALNNHKVNGKYPYPTYKRQFNLFIKTLDNECKKYNVEYKVNKYESNKIVSITFDGINAEMLTTMLDCNDVCVSTGSACNTGTESYVLKALGINANNTIRVSFDSDTKTSDIIAGAKKIAECASKLSKK